MKVYKNPWVSRDQYFVPTGAGKSFKAEAQKTAGYSIDFWQGKWVVRKTAFYNSSLRQMEIVANTKESIESIVNRAILNAILDAVGAEKTKTE